MTVQLIGIYVPLDVLFDTRIATVARTFGDDVASQVLSGYYHTRVDDKFPGVDVDAYKAAYANRNTDTLENIAITGAFDFLQEITGKLMQQAIARPFHDGVRIVVNTYPYKLDPEEMQILNEGLAAKMNAFTMVGIPFKLETVFKSEAELTPAYCKENFAVMLMYDYGDWWAAQQSALQKSPCTEISLYAPAIYHVQTPTEDEIEQSRQIFGKEPFEVMMKTAKPWIDLHLIAAEHFSIVRPA